MPPRFPTTQRPPRTPIDARVDVAVDYLRHVFNQQTFQYADPAVARDQANEINARAAMVLGDILVDDETSRSWVVTLGAIELQTPNDSGAPPCIIFGSPDGNPMATDGDQYPLRVLVDWGTAGATHQAHVDWPVMGASFVVHGSQVRLTSAFPPSVFSPDVGGGSIHKARLVASIVPCSATRPARETPRATVMYGSIADDTLAMTQPIPKHAIAWRPIVDGQNVSPPDSFDITQSIDSAVIRTLTTMNFQASSPHIRTEGVGPVVANAWAPGGWFSVHPLAQFMTITTHAVGMGATAIEYMLDLG